MTGLFDFLSNDDYEERKVERYETDEVIVDTCAANDQPEPFEYETAIAHREYNGGSWIIVELYKTKKESRIGHKKWVKLMTAEILPEKLIDISDIGLTKAMDTLEEEGETWRIFKRKKGGKEK